MSDDLRFPPPTPLPDPSQRPVLHVHLDLGRGTLSWKAERKGARWHNRCRSMEDVARDAIAAGMAAPFVVDFVAART